MAVNNNMIKCQYGNHMADRENDFTYSGLNNKYTICRKCKALKERLYRQKHKTEYNEKHKIYLRKWRNKENNEIII